MANELKKGTVKLGGVALAGTAAIAWKFVGGVTPYSTTFVVHKRVWDSKLKGQKGKPLALAITDSRGVSTTIEQVYILHEAPSDSPHRVAFVVADKRWKWGYKLVARDYNVPRKTGDRTARNTVPIETATIVDKFDYLAYSLKGDQGAKWTAREVVEDVLKILEGDNGYTVDSFPIKDTSGGANSGEFSIQGIMLRDSGDVALARTLSYVPGAEVYVQPDGRVVVFDATDLDATEDYFRGLPPSTYTGESASWIDRKKIRPKRVIVHYQREVELLLEFEDDYSGQTSAAPARSRPYIENVLPTVDPQTVVREFDPETGTERSKTVRPGTWVRVDRWLEAMNATRPADSLEWTFDTIKRHWLKGDLEGVLGARGLDLDERANVAMRVQALRQHFRQTFRINRRYTERFRSIRPVRVGILDPVSGARAPAAVWGQACIISSTKGKYMAARGTEDVSKLGVYRNVDYLAPSRNAGASVIDTAPGPTRVAFEDEDLGIFRLDWVASPYGTVDSFIPCNLVDEQGFNGIVVNRDLATQDDKPMGAAMVVEGGSNGIFLADSLEYAVVVTVVSAAPNNTRQFHRIEVKAEDVATIFAKEYRITGGEGPDLEVFVPPGEATARFALSNDIQATATVQALLALDGGEGVEGPELPGYVLCNEERYLQGHAVSLAAELLASFADNVQGTVTTRVPDGGAKLVGNMSGATIRVASAPSAKVDLVSQFPGQQRTISRLALMPESTRQIVLGVIPFR